MPFSVPTAQAFPWDVPLSRHLAQLNDPISGGINTWATNPTVGVDGAALGTNHVGYTGINTKDGTIVRWDGTKWVSSLYGSKYVDDPQLTVYVDQTTGSDSNTGLSISSPWKTISKLYQELNKYQLNGKQVNIRLGPGAYSINYLPPSVSGVDIQGVSSTSVTLQALHLSNKTCYLSKVTLAFPDIPNDWSWHVCSLSNSTLYIMDDVVVGSLGPYTPGNTIRFPFHVQNDSVINLYGKYPLTVTADHSALFVLATGGTMIVWCYAGSIVSTFPSTYIPVDNGTPATTFSQSPSDTIAKINFIGSRKVDTIFLCQNSIMAGAPGGWKLEITGSVTGKAYSLYTNTRWDFTTALAGSTLASTMYQGIIFPTSISAGSVDSTSILTQAGI